MPEIKYMQRCIDLALNGAGNVAPNPMVGAVIVYNGIIIGEGYHQQYGGSHAEVNAINSVAEKDKHLIEKSTLYVSLEPCAHFGKTPPCSDLIIEKKIPEVVIGCKDTFSEVSGKGIKKLESAGIKVHVGILESECRELNKRFFTFHEKKRPYIILKWAQTANGLIASSNVADEKSISNSYVKKLVHKWRSEEMAIMVGTNTALCDNPELTVREWPGKNPLRVVIDKDLRLPQSLKLFDNSTPTLVFTQVEKESEEKITYQKIDFTSDIASQMLNYLYKINIQSLFIEGGTRLLETFIEKGLWDEARVITSDTKFQSGVTAPNVKGEEIFNSDIHGNHLCIYKNI